MEVRAVSQDGEELPDFSDLFSLRKPRDIGAGLASGAKSVAKGVLAGAVGLLAAPAIGAHQEGLKGFAKGAAAGLLSAVVLPVTGVAVGAAQVVRGAANTPEALKQASLGRHWDESSRAWIDPPGHALVPDGDAQQQARSQWRRQQQRARRGRGGGGQPDEDDFYQLLGVERDASPDEIKKQYYLLARRMHPDKNPDDPEANARFQRLGEAYQVLGNADLRKRYDMYGSEGLDVNYVDGAEFFTALFGSERFKHLVGELMLAAAARHGGEFQPNELRRLQHEREAELVVMLCALLRRYVEGDAEGFQEMMEGEAAELAQASFGGTMLKAIGSAYRAAADVFLGNFFEGSLAALKAKGRGIKAQFSAASLALKVYQRQQEIARLDALEQQARQQAQQQQQQNGFHGGIGQGLAAADSQAGSQPEAQQDGVSAAALAANAAAAERAKLEEQSLPLMLEAMWAANRLDIEATLRHVCKKVLHDEQATKTQRRLRGEALRLLGHIFTSAAQKAAADKAASSGGASTGGSPQAAARSGATRTSAGTVAATAGAGNGSAAAPLSAEERRRRREAEERRQQEERQQAAKAQMEAAMMAVMQRRMQQQDAAT